MRLPRIATLLLGAVWVVLGVLKLDATGDPARAIPVFIPRGVAVVVARLGIGLELLLGAVLASGWRRLQHPALVVSVALLALFGVNALLDAPVRCACAGRAANLSPLGHTALIAAMLAVSAVGLRGIETRSDRPVRSGRLLLVLCAAVTAIAVVIVLATRPPAPRIAPVVPEKLDRPPVADAPTFVDSATLQGSGRAAPLVDANAPSSGEVRDGAIVGVVVDESGRSLGGVVVWAAPKTLGFAALPPGRVVASSPDGAFRLGAPEEPGEWWILARGDSFLPFSQRWPDRAGEFRIVLRRGRCLRGRVVDPGGIGVAGAIVEGWGTLGEDVAFNADAVFGPDVVPEYARVVSDDSGRFELCGAPDGEMRVIARKKGWFSARIGAPLKVPAGADPFLTLDLAPIYVLNAKATDRSTGRPIASASYELILPSDSHWTSAMDSVTRYPSLRGGRSGFINAGSVVAEFVRKEASGSERASVTVTVSAPGYARRVVEVPLVPASEPPQVYPIDLERRGEDALVPVRISARWRNGAKYFGSLLVRVGDGGSGAPKWVTPWIPVVFVGGVSDDAIELPPGSYFARARGHEGSSAPWGPAVTMAPFEVTSGSPNGAVDLTLEGGQLLVEARSGTGVPLQEFTISFTGRTAAMTISTWYSALPYSVVSELTATSDSGRVFFLEPGEIRLHLAKAGFAPQETSVTVAADGGVARWAPVLLRR